MKSWVVRVRNERGVALPLALFTLVSLSAFVLAFLSMGGMEPQIARNLSDSTQARYLADAGIEWGFDALGSAPAAPLPGSWQDILTKGGTLTNSQLLPGLTATQGTFTVTIRNDNQPGDQLLTGWINPATGVAAPDPGNNTTDTNGILIVTSTGTLNAGTPNQAQRQIQVVMQIIPLPPFPGAVNLPGFQADITFANPSIDVDGRDWVHDKNGTYALKPDQSKMNYGVAVQPGDQKNVAMTYEKRAEDGFTIPGYTNKVQGKSQAGGGLTTGVDAVIPDPTLNPTVVYNFLNQLKALPTTTLLTSTKACQAKLKGDPKSPTQPTLSYSGGSGRSSCPPNQTVDLGTPDSPKLVFFNPEREYNGAFPGLDVQAGQPIKGAGILVVMDGDMNVFSDLQWDGIVFVTGQRVGLGIKGNGKMTVHGAVVVLEDQWDEALSSSQKPYGYTGDFNTMNSASATYRNSSQNIAMAQNMSTLKRMWGWREM